MLMTATYSLSKDQLAALAAEHPEAHLHVLTAETDEQVVVRRPSRIEWKRFRGQMNNPARRDEAPEAMLLACLVWPDAKGFDAMLEDRPGLAETFASALLEVAGLTAKTEKKAL